MELRQERKDRFRIEKLEERIAPSTVNISVPPNPGGMNGSLSITTGNGPASITGSFTNHGTSRSLNLNP